MTKPEPESIVVLGHSVGERITVLKSGQRGVISSIHVGLSGAWFHVVLDGKVNQKKLRWEEFL